MITCESLLLLEGMQVPSYAAMVRLHPNGEFYVFVGGRWHQTEHEGGHPGYRVVTAIVQGDTLARLLEWQKVVRDDRYQ